MIRNITLLLLLLFVIVSARRYYDAETGVWISVDPKMQFASPYAYTGNGYNPINSIDPDGMEQAILTSSGKGSGNRFGHSTYAVGNKYLGNYTFDFAPNEGGLKVLFGASVNGGVTMGEYKSIKKYENNQWRIFRFLNQGNDVDSYVKFESSVLEDFAGWGLAFFKMMEINLSGQKYNLYENACVDLPKEAINGSLGTNISKNIPNNVSTSAIENGGELQ